MIVLRGKRSRYNCIQCEIRNAICCGRPPSLMAGAAVMAGWMAGGHQLLLLLPSRVIRAFIAFSFPPIFSAPSDTRVRVLLFLLLLLRQWRFFFFQRTAPLFSLSCALVSAGDFFSFFWLAILIR